MSLAPRRRWEVRRLPADAELDVTTGDARLDAILHGRGYTSAADLEAFLSPQPRDLLGTFELPGMMEASTLLRQAIRANRRIVVHGDYDADGLAATAILVRGLRSLGAKVFPYVPERIATGYGLDGSYIPKLAAHADVLVTVDCGITAVDEVRAARDLGMTVIVTDHHQPGPVLPDADALVTSRLGEGTRGRDLTGAGIAYHLWRALADVARRVGSHDTGIEGELLQLAALGTVADVAPLLGVNRWLVRAGLAEMRARPSHWAQALGRTTGTPAKLFRAETISFSLAPRINSAGRMGSSLPALGLLLASSAAEAMRLAQRLERINRARQAEVRRCLRAQVDADPPIDGAPPIIFTLSSEIPQGIVGLVAGRLADEHGLPAVVANLDGDSASASLRCPEWFSAAAALEACTHLLDKHGGHTRAAGFSCTLDQWGAVQAHLAAWATERAPTAAVEFDPLAIDVEAPLVGAEDPLWASMDSLEPLGEGNPPPLFLARGVRLIQPSRFGSAGEHLRVQLAQGQSDDLVPAIGFGWGEALPHLGEIADVVYTLDSHAFRDRVERRLRIEDLASP